MSKQSLAAVFFGQAGEFELCAFPIPRPGAGEILVRVLGCTICASDRHSFFGRRTTPTPSILGHEIVGQIVEIGHGAASLDLRGDRLVPGDRVVWTLVASCGMCCNCRNDLPQKCVQAVKYGHQDLEPGRELLGGLSEYCLILPGTGLVKVPDELSLAEACPLGCATATIAAGLDAAGEACDRNVLVVGAGMLGLTACAMAQARGAKSVPCIDPQPDRRSWAIEFGATMCVTPEDAEMAIRKATGGNGVDVALEISGTNAGFQACWDAVRIGGIIVLLGAVFPSPGIALTQEQIVRRNLTLRGVHNYAPRHLAQAVEFMEANHRKYPFDGLVSTWFPLARAREAFHCAEAAAAVRVGIVNE